MSKRIVILSDPRCGSYLTAWTLKNHPQLNVTGELFSGFYGEAVPFSRQAIEDVFQQFDVCIVQRCQVPRDREHVISDVADRVVSLFRQDLIAQYKSFQTALKTGHWIEWHKKPKAGSQIEIQFNQAAFDSWANKILADRRRIMPTVPVLSVAYEWLRDNFDEQIQRIQKFLYLPPIQLSPGIQPTPNHDIRYIGWPKSED